MRIFTCYFGSQYALMAAALNDSIFANYPEGKLIRACMEDCDAATNIDDPKLYSANNEKLKLWAAYVEECNQEQICLIDSDTLVLRPLDEAFDADFDIAYTTRRPLPLGECDTCSARGVAIKQGGKWGFVRGVIPYNCGVVFVRKNERSIALMRKWVEYSQRIMEMRSMARLYIGEYAGVNQRAFRDVLDDVEEGRLDAKIEALPCPIWNCEQESYPLFSEETAVLHIKGWLREHMLFGCPQEKLSEAERALIPVCRDNGYRHASRALTS